MVITSGWRALYVLRQGYLRQGQCCGTWITLAKMSRIALIEGFYKRCSCLARRVIARPGIVSILMRLSNYIYDVISSLLVYIEWVSLWSVTALTI